MPDWVSMIRCSSSAVMLLLSVQVWLLQYGAVLLVAGTEGKRSALTHSRVMIHQPMGGAQGQGFGYRDYGP